MKTLIYILALVASLTSLDAMAAINSGGGINGGGGGTNQTNGLVIKVNGTNVIWPVKLTNSATVTISTNADGSVAFTSIAGGTGTLTGVTNVGGGVSLINSSNAPTIILKSLTNSTAGISFTDNLTNIGATLSANLLLWNSVSTNQFVDTNRFQLATNGIIGMFTTFTNTAINTNTFQSTTNLLVDTNRFQLATNGIISMFTTFTNTAVDTNTYRLGTNVLTDTNMFRLATNGIIGMFTTYTNQATDTNVFRQATNGMVVKQNNNMLKWPLLVTNSATVTWGTNADGSLAATAIASGGGTVGSLINSNLQTTAEGNLIAFHGTDKTNTVPVTLGAGLSINTNQIPFILSVTNSTNNLSYASLSTTLNTVSTNGTNAAFAVAQIQALSAATGSPKVTMYVETVTGTFTGIGLLGEGALASLAVTNTMGGIPIPPNARIYITNESGGTGTTVSIVNAWLVTLTGSAAGNSATPVGTVVNTGASVSGQIPVYSDTTGTNVAPSGATISTTTLVTTNTFATNDWGVVTLAYDGSNQMLVDWSLGSTFKGNITKNTTLIHTNIVANTNRSRTVTVFVRQDSSGTWAVGTMTTNGIVGSGGTNMVVNTNATTITMSAWQSLPFTNGMAWGAVSTNSY